MKRIGIVITDGVGFRNFILSNFIQEAKANFNEVIIFSCLPKLVYEEHQVECKIIELEVFNETFKTWFFRKTKEIAHLQLHQKNNFGIQDNLRANYSKAKNARGFAIRQIYNWTACFHSEKWIQRYNHLQQLSFKKNPITQGYIHLLQKEKIDIVFFTHQRPPFIAPFIYAAETLKVKTAAFIFSWDNLASKNRMAGNFNYYLVWSNLMKEELLKFYQSIKEDQIAVVGTPQFEPFTYERFGYDKNTLVKKFHLDNQKPIVFFTCNDSSSENDPIYLELLANFIQNKRLVKDINLIVRTSPAEEPERFKAIAEKYQFIRWNYPDWTVKRANHQESWTQRVPSVEDLNDLKSLLQYCDFNINVLSTITLDSFIFDKPVINPVFGNKNNGMFDDQKFLDYQHLSKLVDSAASTIVKNETEYLNAVNHLLENGDEKQKQRAQFKELQIGKPLEITSKCIAEKLWEWTKA